MNNKKTKNFLISCLLVFTISVTGCAGVPQNMTNEYSNEELKKSYLNFSWDLFKQSSENPGNIMVSPLSVYAALSMTQNGAEGQTKTDMKNTLKAGEIPEDELNKGLKEWMNDLNSNVEGIDLTVANSIWYRKGFEADEEFLKKNNDYYSAASLKNLDFNDKKAPDTINEWVKDATNGTIDKIIDQINDDMMIYLINAVYFKGDWKDPFSSNNTYKQPFNSPERTENMDFMHRRGDMSYLSSDGTEGVLLPYVGEKFALIALLPPEGETPREMIDNFSANKIWKLIKNKEDKTINLSMPKFESNYENSLIEELSNMGMETAFDPNNADFSLMQKSRDKDLCISDVKHKTFIKVDEKGTEASAVTSIGIGATSAPMQIQELTFDRPFIYGIVDLENGLPLFIGIMENPNEN